jgi:hypothetical protein
MALSTSIVRLTAARASMLMMGEKIREFRGERLQRRVEPPERPREMDVRDRVRPHGPFPFGQPAFGDGKDALA